MKRSFGALVKDSIRCFFKLILALLAGTVLASTVGNIIVKLAVSSEFSRSIIMLVIMIILDVLFIWLFFRNRLTDENESLMYNLTPFLGAVIIQLILCLILDFSTFLAGEGVFELGTVITNIQLNDYEFTVRLADISLGANLISFAVFALIHTASFVMTFLIAKKAE